MCRRVVSSSRSARPMLPDMRSRMSRSVCESRVRLASSRTAYGRPSSCPSTPGSEASRALRLRRLGPLPPGGDVARGRRVREQAGHGIRILFREVAKLAAGQRRKAAQKSGTAQLRKVGAGPVGPRADERPGHSLFRGGKREHCASRPFESSGPCGGHLGFGHAGRLGDDSQHHRGGEKRCHCQQQFGSSPRTAVRAISQ